MDDHTMGRRDFIGTCAAAGVAAGMAPSVATHLANQIAVLPCQAKGNVSNHRALFWHVKQGKTTICDLCPSLCEIQPGERGTCGVRENENGVYVSKVYGKPCEIRSDAMEKGPFFHFLPATKSLALGFAGCNLDCKYCQSAAFAKARPEATDNKNLSPQGLVQQLRKHGYRSVTFTYSEPLQAIEYVLDVAKLARPAGIRVLVHTAAYFNSEPFEEICKSVDAVNIDLKGFTEDFYKKVTGGSLAPVLNNIKRVRRHRGLWLELTNLVVPGYNDDDAVFGKMCRWVLDNCGADTPFHISRFFPQYKFRNVAPTPIETLRRLRKIAFNMGLRYTYLGNLGGDPGESTYCPKCGVKMIGRVGYDVSAVAFDGSTGTCTKCGLKIPGVWQ